MYAIYRIFYFRFYTFFEKKELIIAACVHPKFKLNWLTGEKKKLAASYLDDLLGIKSNENSPIIEQKYDAHDDFFTFHEMSNTSKEEELQTFLKSAKSNVDMLNNYPKLKQMFIQTNTTLPSSASVERLFSVGGAVLVQQRAHLNDNSMEHQLLLKLNKQFR